MFKYDKEAIVRAAKNAIEKEKFDEEVAKEIIRLKTHKPWYRRLFPFVITISRRV